MKHFNLLFTLTFASLFLVSCGNEYYTEKVYVNSTTKYYTINKWILEDTPPVRGEYDDSNYTYFYCDIYEPALTNEVFDYGIMSAYLTDKKNKSIISPLPYNDYYRSPRGSMWTEQVTCEFSPKYIRFIVKYNDFEINEPPMEYTFMVRFVW